MKNPKLIEFETSDHLLLPGLLFKPEKKTKKAAIYLHGNGSASVFYSVKRAHAFARALTKQNIAFFTFNNRGAHYIKTINEAEKKADAKNEQTLGTAYELIKDCIHDIDGALNFLKEQGFQEFYLVGHSSGANKVCVYDYYQPENLVSKYILLGGGDDTGIFYQLAGNKQLFFKYLAQARNKINQGNGQKLVPKYITDFILSYQSYYDICNPDGDYNTFPFYEHLNQVQLSTKPLFRYFKNISKPNLVIYGENDNYAPKKSGRLASQVLQEQVEDQGNFEFEVIKDGDHSFHGQEEVLAQRISNWL